MRGVYASLCPGKGNPVWVYKRTIGEKITLRKKSKFSGLAPPVPKTHCKAASRSNTLKINT